MTYLQKTFKAIIKPGNQGQGQDENDTVVVIAKGESQVFTPPTNTVTPAMSFSQLEKEYGDVDGFAEAAGTIDTSVDWDAMIAELPTNTNNNTTLSNAILDLIDQVRG